MHELNEYVIATDFALSEAVAQRFSVKNVFLDISQNSQENTCARVSFLIKLQALGFCFCSFSDGNVNLTITSQPFIIFTPAPMKR